MAERDRDCPYLIPAAEIERRANRFSHPWNENSELVGTHLSPLAGLEDVGISRVTLPPGRESFVYHQHQHEEEWIYVLSGRGIAEINDRGYEVGPGDFMGFPAGEVAHHLRNPFDEPLDYLMGGSNRRIEIARFPRLGRVMLKEGDRVRVFDDADGEDFQVD